MSLCVGCFAPSEKFVKVGDAFGLQRWEGELSLVPGIEGQSTGKETQRGLAIRPPLLPGTPTTSLYLPEPHFIYGALDGIMASPGPPTGLSEALQFISGHFLDGSLVPGLGVRRRQSRQQQDQPSWSAPGRGRCLPSQEGSGRWTLEVEESSWVKGMWCVG